MDSTSTNQYAVRQLGPGQWAVQRKAVPNFRLSSTTKATKASQRKARTSSSN